MVGGGTVQVPSVVLYRYNIEVDTVEKAKIFTMDAGQEVTSGTYSPEGSKFYAVTDDNMLIGINPYNYSQTNVQL